MDELADEALAYDEDIADGESPAVAKRARLRVRTSSLLGACRGGGGGRGGGAVRQR